MLVEIPSRQNSGLSADVDVGKAFSFGIMCCTCEMKAREDARTHNCCEMNSDRLAMCDNGSLTLLPACYALRIERHRVLFCATRLNMGVFPKALCTVVRRPAVSLMVPRADLFCAMFQNQIIRRSFFPRFRSFIRIRSLFTDFWAVAPSYRFHSRSLARLKLVSSDLLQFRRSFANVLSDTRSSITDTLHCRTLWSLSTVCLSSCNCTYGNGHALFAMHQQKN